MGISWSRTEVVTKRVEHSLESGSVITDLDKLRAIVWVDYCKLNGLDPKEAKVWDDWCRVEARDDEIVLVFAVEMRQGEVADHG